MLPEGYIFNNLTEKRKREINYWKDTVETNLENTIVEICSDLECSFTLATITEEILRKFKERFITNFYSSIDDLIFFEDDECFIKEEEGENKDE